MVIKTATSLVFLFLLLFLPLAGAGRTKLHSRLESSNNADGICQSMVQTQGYRCEDHQVTTEDGYILSLKRIPTGRSGGTNKGAKPPVLLQHGLISDATTWLASYTNESLGFILADGGYDVWMVSTRGTNYSSGHISLSTDDADYWDWSWDELAAYDVPASFQYVYNQTGQKLHYVGYSLGTLMALGAFSRKEVVNMVRSAALLAPLAYMGQMPSPLARAAADVFSAEVLHWLGRKEFSPRGGAGSKLLKSICQKSDCADILGVITGPNCCLRSPNLFLERLQPTSTKIMIHLSQMIREGTIAMYDYGDEDDNNEHYGQPTPPVYNMTSIPKDLPLFLGYGGKDLLSDVKDVPTLIDVLSADREPGKLVLHYSEGYAHLDFAFAHNAKQVVYDALMHFFRLN